MCKYFSNVLVVGGTGRNTGKTTLVEQLIRKFKDQYTVVALKTSMLLPGEEYLHGRHLLKKSDTFFIYEEDNSEGKKDSQRFLKAGAKKSYFISANSNKAFGIAMQELLPKQDSRILIIVESNVILDYIKPAVFLMVVGENMNKPKYSDLLNKADKLIIAMNKISFNRVVDTIDVKTNKLGILKIEFIP